jgi:hypothetical protein
MERRAIVAALIGYHDDVLPNIQVGVFVDTGADTNVIGRQWLSQLLAEGVLVEQHEEDIDLGWSIGDAGITVREKVRLRLVFIGWAEAPEDIREVFFITDMPSSTEC